MTFVSLLRKYKIFRELTQLLHLFYSRIQFTAAVSLFLLHGLITFPLHNTSYGASEVLDDISGSPALSVVSDCEGDEERLIPSREWTLMLLDRALVDVELMDSFSSVPL